MADIKELEVHACLGATWRASAFGWVDIQFMFVRNDAKKWYEVIAGAKLELEGSLMRGLYLEKEYIITDCELSNCTNADLWDFMHDDFDEILVQVAGLPGPKL